MVSSLIRYLKLWFTVAKLSMQMEIEYRGSFILEIMVEIGFFLVILVNFVVIYSNVNTIAGWSRYETMLLIGIYMVFSEILLGTAFIFNLRDLPYKISTGNLDLILTKPINSQYAVSLWRPYFASLPSLLSGFIVGIFGIVNLHLSLTILSFAIFISAFIGGLVIAYSLGMIITTLSMWLINATPLPFLAQQIIFISGRPSSVFSGTLRLIFLYLIPVIMMLSLPVELLLGKSPYWWVVIIWLFAIIFLCLSRYFWYFALRRYSSASS